MDVLTTSPLLDVDRPCWAIESAGTVRLTGDERVACSADRVLAAVGPLPPRLLGSPDFLAAHGVRRPYMSGAMANGIASARLVASMARAGYLAAFGAGGLSPKRIDAALGEIRRAAPGRPFACNLIHSPNEPALERSIVDLCLRHGVPVVEAAAFMDLTREVVRYRVTGLAADRSGAVLPRHRVIAKVSRPEVAAHFLRPAPDALLRQLVEAGSVTAAQAGLAARVPMADDITAEADSGGHTDRRPLAVLLPELAALRDRIHAETGVGHAVRIGAAGGLGTPAAVHAAFALGADYVVTGSVNQACVEAAQSDRVKAMLVAAGGADYVMAPAADMFELGVDVQVLTRGTMFAARARRLYDTYRGYDSLEDIPAALREKLERDIFRRGFDDVWRETAGFFARRDPDQLARAETDPKRRMGLVFRWYLGLSSSWGIAGAADRAADYQVWCGPAMGAFNGWVAGTCLEAAENRTVAGVADHLLRGAAVAARAAQLRFAGVRLPDGAGDYRPATPTLEGQR